MSDYPQIITPGAKCSSCENHGLIIITSIGPLIKCKLYGAFYENNQAEHCINHYVPKIKEDKNVGHS